MAGLRVTKRLLGRRQQSDRSFEVAAIGQRTGHDESALDKNLPVDACLSQLVPDAQDCLVVPERPFAVRDDRMLVERAREIVKGAATRGRPPASGRAYKASGRRARGPPPHPAPGGRARAARRGPRGTGRARTHVSRSPAVAPGPRTDPGRARPGAHRGPPWAVPHPRHACGPGAHVRIPRVPATSVTGRGERRGLAGVAFVPDP